MKVGQLSNVFLGVNHNDLSNGKTDSGHLIKQFKITEETLDQLLSLGVENFFPAGNLVSTEEHIQEVTLKLQAFKGENEGVALRVINIILEKYKVLLLLLMELAPWGIDEEAESEINLEAKHVDEEREYEEQLVKLMQLITMNKEGSHFESKFLRKVTFEFDRGGNVVFDKLNYLEIPIIRLFKLVKLIYNSNQDLLPKHLLLPEISPYMYMQKRNYMRFTYKFVEFMWRETKPELGAVLFRNDLYRVYHHMLTVSNRGFKTAKASSCTKGVKRGIEYRLKEWYKGGKNMR